MQQRKINETLNKSQILAFKAKIQKTPQNNAIQNNRNAKNCSAFKLLRKVKTYRKMDFFKGKIVIKLIF